MNDKDNTKLSDLSVTDLDNMDWDKYTLIGQCDRCNNPVNLDDASYVSESKVYCKECTSTKKKSRFSFMDKYKKR